MAPPLFDLVGSAVAAAFAVDPHDVCSMPVAATVRVGGGGSIRSVAPFGLSGQRGARVFRPSLEIQAAGAPGVELLAMCAGTMNKVPAGFQVGPPVNPDALGYRTRGPALVIHANLPGTIASAFSQRINPASVHDLPKPEWVVYEIQNEAFTLDAALSPIERIDVLSGIPNNVPAVIGPNDNNPAFYDPEPADLDNVVAPYDGLPTALQDRFDVVLEDLADRILANPSRSIGPIVGHTDSVGFESDNLPLSVRRARMIRQRLVQVLLERELLLERESLMEWDDWMAMLPLAGSGEMELWFTRDRTADARRAGNRRVEIFSGDPVPIAAGARLGTFTGAVKITMLDRTGRLLDPLAVVRRYDIGARFSMHPFASLRDATAPAITSGVIHVLSPGDPAAATGSGAASTLAHEGADPASADYFQFPQTTLADRNPLASVMGDVKFGDVIWITDQTPASPPIPTDVTVTTGISIVSGGATLRPLPASAGAAATTPIIRVQAASGLGVRLLGLNFQGGHSLDVDGGAISASRGRNLHVGSCAFLANTADGAAARGGAIALDHMTNTLIEDCVFTTNHAAQGGAIFAASCDLLAIAGPPLTATALTQLTQFLESSDRVLPHGASDPAAFGATFRDNSATGAGGAVAMIDTTFHIGDCAFTSNQAGTSGGAIAAFVALPTPAQKTALAQARLQASLQDTVRTENLVTRCLLADNDAPAGAGIALGGAETDLRIEGDLLGGSESGTSVKIESNLIIRNGVVAPRDNCVLGGGLCLAAGAAVLSANRIAENRSRSYGGGIACIANVRVSSSRNRIVSNHALDEFAAPLPDLGKTGGGALFACGFGDDARRNVTLVLPTANVLLNRTVVQLIDDIFLANTAAEDGGAILATRGAACYVTGAGGQTLLAGNSAGHNGGAIAVRNAEVAIGGTVTLAQNIARRDGGAIFAGGVSQYRDPNRVSQELANLGAIMPGPPVNPMDVPRALGASMFALDKIGESRVFKVPGTYLQVAALAEFHGNAAEGSGRGQGGAIFLFQQPVNPLLLLVPDASIGILRNVFLTHLSFTANRSDQHGGSTIAALGLDHAWRRLYPAAIPAEAVLLHGAPAPGPYQIGPVDIEVNSGAGVLIFEPTGAASALVSPANTIRLAAGQPAGPTWTSVLSTQAAHQVD